MGCGWLGLPLAGHLLSWHYRINGSTTSEEKLSLLKKWGIRPFLFDLDQPEKWNEKLFQSAVIVINIPPSKSNNFLENLKKLLSFCQDKKILFVSSTSVYSSSAFPITEMGKTLPESESKLVKAENLVRQYCPASTVVRPAGLIGPGRPPGRFLAGKENVSGAKTPVNYVALEDLVMVCAEIIGQDKWGYTFNVANPQHPTKEEFYTESAKEIGLVPPGFDPEQSLDNFKLVDGNAVAANLQLVYHDIPWNKYIKSIR